MLKKGSASGFISSLQHNNAEQCKEQLANRLESECSIRTVLFLSQGQSILVH